MFSKWDGSKMAGCSAGPMLPSIASSEQFKVRYSARTALLAFLGAGLGRVTISSIELQVVVYSNISSRVLRSSNACGCSQWWGDPRGSAARRVRSKFLLYWYNRGPLLYSNSMTHQCKTPTIFLFIFFFFSTRDWTQGLTHGRQVLPYHWVTSPALLFLCFTQLLTV
jgi:hypothetical protein